MIRRNFLKGLLVSPLAAKTAASAIEAEMATGTSPNQVTSPPWMSAANEINLTDLQANHDPILRIQKVMEFLSSNGLPGWKKQQIRRDARHDRRFDGDIVEMQSVSMQHKIRMQERRNGDRAEKEYLETLDIELAKKKYDMITKNKGINFW